MFWFASSVGANTKLPTCENLQGSTLKPFCLYDNDWGADMPVNLPFNNNVMIKNTIYHNNNYFKNEDVDSMMSALNWTDYEKELVLIYTLHGDALHGDVGSWQNVSYRIGNTQEVLTVNDLKNTGMRRDMNTTLDIFFVGNKIADRFGLPVDKIKYDIRPAFVSKEVADTTKSGDEIDIYLSDLGLGMLFGIFLNGIELSRYSINVDTRSRCLLYNGDVIVGFDFEECDLQVTLYNASVPNAADSDGVPGTSDGTCGISPDSPLYGYFQPCAIYRNSNNQVPIRIQLNAYNWKKVPGGFERGEPVNLPNTLAQYLNFTFEVKNNSTQTAPEYNLPNIAEKVRFGDRRNIYTLGSSSGCQNGIENLIPKYQQTKSHEALGIIKYVTADKKFNSLVSSYPISIEIKSVAIGSQRLLPENYENLGIVKLDLLKDEQLNKDGTTALDNQGNIPILGGDALTLKDKFSHDYTLPGVSNSEYFYAYVYNILTPNSSRVTEDKKLCFAKIDLKAFKSLKNTSYPLDPNQYLKPEATHNVNPHLFIEKYNSKWHFDPRGHNTSYIFNNGLQTLFGINSGTFAGIRAKIDQSYSRTDEHTTVWVDKDPKIERNKRVIYGGTYFKVFGYHDLPELLFPQRIVVTTQHGTSYQRHIALGETTPGEDPSSNYYDLTGSDTQYRAWSQID